METPMEMTTFEPRPLRRAVSWDKIEVLEFNFVAGANHPSRHSIADDSDNSSAGRYDSDAAAGTKRDDDNHMDSASVALAWKPSSRTSMDLDQFEAGRKPKKKGNRFMRMTRAVRKRL